MRLRFLVTCATVWVTLAANLASAQVTNCPFNVSQTTPTGAADSLRDSVVLMRYARGMRGAALVAGTGLSDATVTTNITANINKLDINGNGLFDEDDATVISRLTFSFRSDKWFTPTLPSTNLGSNYASRTTTAGVQKYVEAGCPAAAMPNPTADQIAASRFLIQSTFGPSMQDIVSFLALGADQNARRNAWLNTQLAARTGQKHFDYLLQRKTEYDAQSKEFGSEMAREAFWISCANVWRLHCRKFLWCHHKAARTILTNSPRILTCLLTMRLEITATFLRRWRFRPRWVAT
jgi:hypothetical protein